MTIPVVAKVATGLSLLGIAAITGAWLRPPRVVTKTVDREVVKYVDRVEWRDRVEYRDRVQTVRRVVRVVVQPDGTKVTEATTDTGTVDRAGAKDAAVVAVKQQEATKEHETVKTAPAQREWNLSVLTGARPSSLGAWNDLAYQAALSRRIVGPFGVGAAVSWGPSEPLRLWAGMNWSF